MSDIGTKKRVYLKKIDKKIILNTNDSKFNYQH